MSLALPSTYYDDFTRVQRPTHVAKRDSFGISLNVLPYSIVLYSVTQIVWWRQRSLTNTPLLFIFDMSLCETDKMKKQERLCKRWATLAVYALKDGGFQTL